MEKGAGASLRLFSCEKEGTGMRSRTEAFGFPKVKKTKGSAEKMSCEKSRGFVRRKRKGILRKRKTPRRRRAAGRGGNREWESGKEKEKRSERGEKPPFVRPCGEIGGDIRSGEIGGVMRGASLNCQRRNTVSPSFIVRSTTISRSFSAGVRSGFPERRTRFSRFPAASVPVVFSSKY